MLPYNAFGATGGGGSEVILKVFIGFLILGLVAMLYWPVTRDGFVWLDRVCFDDSAWVAYADDWKKLLTHNFYGWINYFRPLVIALFAIEIRTFGSSPMPMHLVSLALHLLNTALVGLLALQIISRSPLSRGGILLCGICMLLYGLHPALIEPVVWISCQFELTVTFFMLLGLWLNEKIISTPIRTVSISICFFLAACCKESAMSFPLVLLLFDVVRHGGIGISDKLRNAWRSQRYIYFSLVVSGIVYLILRHAWLGAFLQSTRNEPALSTQRFQEIFATYLTYWRIILWPMYKLGPLHEVSVASFQVVDLASLIIDFSAILIVASGFFLAVKRSYLGLIVVAVTFSLLPVLHLIPVAFDESLYHERYAMFAVAMVMAFLPAAICQRIKNPTPKWLYAFGSGIAFVWCTAAIANIRVTVPLWSDEMTLWRWMQREHPDSLIVKDHLLSTYIELGDYGDAEPLADQLVAADAPCPNCLLNAANMALAQNDLPRASNALAHLKESKLITSQPHIVEGYVMATGRLLELQGRISEAEEAYRGAITLDPLDPEARIDLALLFARNHRPVEARNEADNALKLYSAKDRALKTRGLERKLDHIFSIPGK